MRRYKNRKGQDLVEYGALLVIFVMFAILAINAIRSSTGEIYGNVESGVDQARQISDKAAQDAQRRTEPAQPQAQPQPPAETAQPAAPGGEAAH